MADEKDDKKAGEKQDPIVDRSLAPHFLVSSTLLMLTVVWAVYGEQVGYRPYKHFQGAFQSLALEKAGYDREAAKAELEQQKASADYQQADAAVKKLEGEAQALAARRAELEKERDRLTGELNKVRGQFQIARGDYQPLVYELDHANLEGHPDQAKKLYDKIKLLEPKIQEIFANMIELSRQKNKVAGELGSIDEPLGAARRNLSEKVPSAKKLADAEVKLGKDGPLHQMEVGYLKPYQIYNPGLNVVDRCTSCHVAVDKPGYTKADWDALKGKISDPHLEEAKAVFATHPNLLSADPKAFDWLGAHTMSKFGCTSCHWGNGPATSEEKAHALEGAPGQNYSWTHPMEFQLTPLLPYGSLEKVAAGQQHFGNMMEAACSKCHTTEVNLKGAPQISYARQLVEDLGCWGCHKIKGFELRELELAGLQDKVHKDLEPKKDGLAKLISSGEDSRANREQLVGVAHEISTSERRIRELDQEIKFIGPDLNRDGKAGLKSKIYASWLPRWIYDPQHFRPGTWMPNALLAEDEAIDLAAYVWQQAKGTPTDAIAAQGVSAADAAEGKVLVQSRGCIACHTLEDQGTALDVEAMRTKLVKTPKGDIVPENGDKFAINDVEKWWQDPASAPIQDGGRGDLLKKASKFGPSLAKVGEKIRVEWLAEWVHEPKSLQPHTRMPSLRLSPAEAGKIAAYLTTLKSTPDAHPGGTRFAKVERSALEDPKRAENGLKLVVRYGCFNCHAIDLKDPASGKPVVNPGKIGAELSSHGSKPLAQFDFSFAGRKEDRGPGVPETRNAWLMTKILEPRIWDRGRYKGDPNDRLRMPRFGLNAPEAAAVTTLLVGLTDGSVPADYVYRPNARNAAIIEGERLVRKFNCRSCHVINGDGQWAKAELTAAIEAAVPEVKAGNADAAAYMPPPLNGQGHRTEPAWLFKFLKNPAPFTGPEHPLRPWHVIRMPTFDMSDAEATALVEYFSALEKDPYPYEPKEVVETKELTEQGRAIFHKPANQGGPGCAACHMIGGVIPKGKKPTELGPDLAWTRDRLRADWIDRFLPDPQASVRGANMPSFFGEKPFSVQPPEKQREIQALRAYVRSLADPAVRARDFSQ